MSDFLSGLNPVQRQAAEQYQGPALVIAGAGSGKTRVLTYRIAHMLQQGVQPYSVLSLTFTNKAAKEMKERIAHLVGDDQARSLWMGTFHSIFARILRAEAPLLGFPTSFSIYDTVDSKSLLRKIIKDLQLDENVYKVNEVLSRISMAKNNLITSAAYASSAAIAAADAQGRKYKMPEIYHQYAKRCSVAGAMDFDDLLLYTNILFRDHPQALDKYRNKFRYILVDEYQDTNYAQYLIVKKLSELHRNLCVVGDDAQSIYSFRGAKIENILNFQKDYPECKTFKLEQNYRSTQTIVNAANSVIEKNKKQLQKACFSDGDKGELVGVIKTFTDQEEGFRVAGDIASRIYSDQAPYSEFAILYRTNAQSRIFEDALRKNNIPYRIYGGISFYQRKEIKDLIAYLRLVVNHKDNEAFLRVINYPKRGIGDTTIERIEQVSVEQGLSLWEAILTLTPGQADIKGAAYKKISDFLLMVASFRERVEVDDAYELAKEVAMRSGIMTELRAEKTVEGVAKLENVEELLNGIQEFAQNYLEEHGEPPRLSHFLESVSLLTDADNNKPEDRNSVSLMTVHSSKGLEFGYVYIVGAEEGLFPGQNTATSEQQLEEERRLFYVAITRAKRKVTLSFAQSRMRWGSFTTATPSRFVQEINPAYIDYSFDPGTALRDYSQDPEDYAPPASPTYTKRKEYGHPQQALRSSTSPGASPSPSPLPSPPAGSMAGAFKAQQRGGNSRFVASDPSQIQAGVQVEHERFGAGQVLSVEGQGPDTKAVVNFAVAGQKTLLLKFARLMVVGGGA